MWWLGLQNFFLSSLYAFDVQPYLGSTALSGLWGFYDFITDDFQKQTYPVNAHPPLTLWLACEFATVVLLHGIHKNIQKF